MAASVHPQQERTRTPRSVAVIGSGVSGLAAAYKLKCQGVAVTVFEADERIGGKIMSISQDGLIWEKGANTMTESEPEVKQLINELGIREQQQFVAETRFASYTIVLRRLVRVKEALCQMVISNKWGGWKQVDTEKAKIVKDLIFSDDFWNRVEYALELTEPLMSMLRYADTDEPCLGNIYDAMDSMLERMKSVIQRREQDPDTLYSTVEKIVLHRWNKMTTPLHLLAYALSPRYYSSEILDIPGRVPPYRDPEVAAGYKRALNRLFSDPDVASNVRREFVDFVSGKFAEPDAINDQSRLDAIGWWYLHGERYMYLQPLAIKILSQPIKQNKRYIVKNGEPQLLPSNPLVLIGSKFLSARAKLNFYMEPILWKRRKPEEISGSNSKQESVGNFFKRHFGEEIVEYLLDPFVAGTTGADTESVSMQHAFPEMWDLEERFGSIIIGGMKSIWSRKKAERDTKVSGGKKNQRGSFSFMGGMQTLTNALSTKLEEESLKLQSSVLSLSCDLRGNPSHSSWSINYAMTGYKEPVQEELFDAVIMTAPFCKFRDMKISQNGKPFPLDFLPNVTYLPISVIITTFKKQDVKRPLEGFGILVPSKEEKNGFQTLGTIFSSSMFPDRAPSDQYLFTTLIGGSRNKNLAKSSSKELQEVALNDLNKLLGIEKHPLKVKHVYWSEAFPLYSLNYNLVLDAIDKIEKTFPGLYFAGNYRGGLSVGKALVSGLKAADLAINHLMSLDANCEA